MCTGHGEAVLGVAAWLPQKAPERLKPRSQPRGAHPRLSLSEATRLHPPWPAWSLPQVGGPHTFFPAESTCTNIDSKMLIRQDRGSMKTTTPPPQGPALWVRSKEDPCLPSICPPGCLTVTAGWKERKAYVQLSHLSRSGSGSRTAALGTIQSECRPLASLDTAPPTPSPPASLCSAASSPDLSRCYRALRKRKKSLLKQKPNKSLLSYF